MDLSRVDKPSVGKNGGNGPTLGGGGVEPVPEVDLLTNKRDSHCFFLFHHGGNVRH